MGSDNKVMFFRNINTGAQFGVGLFHGSHVSLSAFGAGVRGSAINEGDSTDNCRFLAKVLAHYQPL